MPEDNFLDTHESEDLFPLVGVFTNLIEADRSIVVQVVVVMS